MATAGLLPLMSENGREGWSDGGGDQVEDEFACVGALRGTLVSFHPSVERIFGVSFRIGREEDAELSHNGQIWLKLRGVRKNVLAAKHFVRGVVNQEEQQEVPYPEVLHCVFCGARGLFMDCLIKNTFAHIVVGSPGFLLISGLTEPVVRAYSLITDLVERYEGTQGCRTEAGDRGAGESLDSRRAFKSLVENWEDRHTLDLLVLPGSVKETLLDLVRESGLGSKPGHGDTESQRLWETQSDVERLTLLDNRVGETRQVHGIPTSADKPLENSTHHQEDPDARLQNNEPFGSPSVQGRDGTREGTGRDTASPDPFLRFFPPIVDVRGKAEGAEAGRECSPQEVGEEEQQEKVEEEEEEEEEGEGEGGELLLSVGSRVEFGLLLKFFTAMGYDEGVVRRVLARTGPREASQLLDLVQQEQDLYGREKNLNHNRPSETEHIEGQGEERRDEGTEGGVRCGVRGREGHREEEEWRDEGLQVKKSATGGGVGVGVKEGVVKGEMAGEEQRMEGGERRREDTLGKGSDDGGQERGKEDFVLGVLLRAAASCGYTEEKVAEVYSMQPELSTRLLLLELQREGARETDTQAAERGMEGPMEVDEVVLEVQREAEKREAVAQPFTTAGKRGEKRSLKGKSERKTDEEGGVKVPNQTTDGHIVQLDPAQWNVKKHFQPFPTQPSPHQFSLQIHPQLPQLNTPHQTNPPLVRGPPQPTYPVTLPSQTTNHLTQHPHPTLPPTLTPQLTYPQTLAPQTTFTPILLPALTTNSPSATRTKDRRGFSAHLAGAMVTGEQRFLEGLQTPFDLKLNDQPGDEGLRMVIIDGSNVAMSHGLGHFFSCRGIALAVQHFWTEGHRRISIFLPQWRQKRDPRIKEQHFLTELQNLGLLSYTPSREVQGKRINSYDDRFMLQLAQKTDGVIVTNDNLRDLLVESHVFKDIIKKRLLQYTFVGDHFMVPDDPLGRGGPHLDDFLRSQHRPPVPGSHTFAGVASSFPSSRAPRAHTELLQFRDWTPGVPVDSADSDRGQGRGRRRGQGRAGHMAIGQGQGVERSAEETARLRESLSQVFPGQDSMVTLVLQCNSTVTDINSLSHFILEQQRESEQGAAD